MGLDSQLESHFPSLLRQPFFASELETRTKGKMIFMQKVLTTILEAYFLCLWSTPSTELNPWWGRIAFDSRNVS